MMPTSYPLTVNRLEGITAKTAIGFLAAFIVIGGFALALLNNNTLAANIAYPSSNFSDNAAASASNGSGGPYFATQVVGVPNSQGSITELISTSTTFSTTATGPGTAVVGAGTSTNQTQNLGTGSEIEFSSTIALETTAVQQTASGIVALAYSVGGYVAYQSTFKESAYVVIRVPAASYLSVESKVQAMGNVTSVTSNSNDVRVQYTDLNGTLASLRTEQGALLRLLNQSTTINSTLAIENQLQGINQQINDVESQILQTRTLISFATIDVTISKTALGAPLSMTLTATPLKGTAPFSVTFNAVVKGGAQPYLVNYNFGDGSASQGQILIHTFYSAGDYNVTVTATDQNGTVASATNEIHVAAAQNQIGAPGFPATLANLFVSVVEGIAEVAVVVLPLAAVGAAVVLPLRRRGRSQKAIKQSQ